MKVQLTHSRNLFKTIWNLLFCFSVKCARPLKHFVMVIQDFLIFLLLFTDPKQINPRFQEVEENSDAVIQCKSSSPVNWTFEGRPIPSNAEKFNSTTLYISRVNYANQGYYECEGTYFGQLSMITRAKLMIQGMDFLITDYSKI